MADILKLKKKAADFEAKKQMDKALATYREMIEVYERGEEDPIDIPLYNRVGDLLQKSGNLPEAVSLWERAVDHYAEGGFYNPAIALCNKILRQSPGRTVVYYKLGKISAEKGFKADARQNFLEYAARMQKAGNLDEAFRALKEFADLVPDQDDVRLMLADQLVKAGRKDEAIEQLQVAYAQCVSDGRQDEADTLAERMKAIDPTVEPRAEARGASAGGGGLVFLDLDPEPGPARASIRTQAPAETRRLSKAVAGLDLLDTGTDATPPAPAHLTPLATPAVRAAAAAPAPAPELLIEPTSIVESAPATAPVVSDAMLIDTTPIVEAASTTSVSDLILEPTAFGGDAPPPARATLSGLEATSLIEEPIAEIPLLDVDAAFEAPAAPAPEPELPHLETLQSSLDAVEDIPLLDVEEVVPTAAPVEQIDVPMPDEGPIVEAPSAIADLPMLDDAPIVEAPSAKVDLPMLDEEPIVETSSAPSLSDFNSFGSAPAPTDGLDLLQVESSEDYQSLPFSTPSDDAPAPSLIETTPESLLPPMELEEEPTIVPVTRATSSVLANSVDLLRIRVDEAPEDWGLRRQFAEALLDDGQRDAGVIELEAALAGFESIGDLDTAASVAEEIVRLAPDVIKYHQKRVEFAFRANDRMQLAEAYVELADALFKDGQGPKARVVYQRVLEIAPDDLRAQAALETIKEEPPVAPAAPRRSTTMVKKPTVATPTVTPTAKPAAKKPADQEFVSLGDWLREDDEPKSTRMVVEEKEPTGDEQADFADMLRKFKKGVSDNVDEEDHEAHYDLGVAYKEMGLLDEAISEFQKSLRGPNNRVRAIEALGQCFVEKTQLPVAATILNRALSEPGVTDDALVGVLYLLGTISEELHLFPDAKRYYQRVFAVDIQFRDVGDRLNAVEKQLT